MTPGTDYSTKTFFTKLSGWIPYILAAALWGVLLLNEQAYLKKVEDQSLFMFDWFFFKESVMIPGGFLGICGSFLTQFLYLPWLGSLIWILSLLMTYQLTVRTFDFPQEFRALAVIPAALLVIGDMSLGYGVFIMREQDFFFAPILGYMAATVPILISKKISHLPVRIILMVLWTFLAYIPLGTFALAGTLALSFVSLFDMTLTKGNRFALFLTGTASIIIAPLIIYNLFTSYNLAHSWQMGLPTLSDDLWTHAVRAPFQLALLFLPVMAMASRFLKNKGKGTFIQVTVYLMAIGSVWGLWFKDENFHTELAMSEAVDLNDWSKVISIFRDAETGHIKSDGKAYQSRTKALKGVTDPDQVSDIVEDFSDRFFEPTRTMVLYRDLALLKSNRALNEAFTMKDGSRLQRSRTQIPMAIQSGKQFYFHYGLVNMSYRWCMEDVIEHYWSYSTLKYMVMHSVIMQESEFADKYLNKLSKTLFYRGWAKKQKELSDNPSLMSQSEPYKSTLPYMCFEDRMSNDMVKTETYLMSHFSDPEPPRATPEYDQAALFWTMRTQAIPAFWQRLYYYLQSNPSSDLPRSVQEAAILYSHLERNGMELPYSKSVQDSYDSFNSFVSTHAIRNMKESSYPFYKRHGKTFYYYYYFMRDMQTY